MGPNTSKEKLKRRARKLPSSYTSKRLDFFLSLYREQVYFNVLLISIITNQVVFSFMLYVSVYLSIYLSIFLHICVYTFSLTTYILYIYLNIYLLSFYFSIFLYPSMHLFQTFFLYQSLWLNYLVWGKALILCSIWAGIYACTKILILGVCMQSI